MKEMFETVEMKDIESGFKETENQDTIQSKKRKRLSKEKNANLREFLAHCDRFNISETAASTLFNIAQKESNEEVMINQSQIHKSKRKFRMKSVKTFEEEEITAIGFDERIDSTKVKVGKGPKGHTRFEKLKQEHCVVVVYPKAEFAGHVVPKDGTGATLARDIHEFTETRGIHWDSINYLVSDG